MIHHPLFRYRMSNWIGVVVGVLAVLSGSLGCAGGAGARVGVNRHELQDDSTQRPFLNLFKQARPWITQCWGDTDCRCT
jgi:hypothetical protein